MESHYSAKFGVHKNCDSVDMLLAVEKEDSRRSRFNPPLLFSTEDMTWKHTAYHINNFDPGHTSSKQQSEENKKITSACPSITTDEAEKKYKGKRPFPNLILFHILLFCS